METKKFPPQKMWRVLFYSMSIICALLLKNAMCAISEIKITLIALLENEASIITIWYIIAVLGLIPERI